MSKEHWKHLTFGLLHHRMAPKNGAEDCDRGTHKHIKPDLDITWQAEYPKKGI